ncbi:MAG TPA: hypothetical protein VJ692_11030 [Nitrospiraceae bacterium]|nr:hypothetical protein [Nitrospiraceae bacterium]
MSGLEWGIVIGVAVLLVALFVGLEILFPEPAKSVTLPTARDEGDENAQPGAKRVA